MLKRCSLWMIVIRIITSRERTSKTVRIWQARARIVTVKHVFITEFNGHVESFRITIWGGCTRDRREQFFDVANVTFAALFVQTSLRNPGESWTLPGSPFFQLCISLAFDHESPASIDSRTFMSFNYKENSKINTFAGCLLFQFKQHWSWTMFSTKFNWNDKK